MPVRKIMLGVAAASLAVAPAVAQGVLAPAKAPLNGDESQLEGGSGIILGVIAAAAVVGAIIIASDDNDNEVPISG